MKTKHFVIYVPGLGASYDKQGQALKLFKLRGIKAELFPVYWSDDEAYDLKFDRLLTRVNDLSHEYDVSLIGVSAGASAVLNAFAAQPQKVHKVITICGKINHPEGIEQWRYQQNPAFRGSIEMMMSSLKNLSLEERKRILCLYPLRDEVVPPGDAILEGAHKKRIPMVGHAFSIVAALIFKVGAMAKFIKN